MASTQHILTTHAGSLPRPPELTALHLAKSNGKQVDEQELLRASELAARDVLALQLDAGIDIVNDGEVGRESFFTYVRHRLTGFGGTGQPRMMPDLLRYPSFLELLAQKYPAAGSVDMSSTPRAVGEVSYRNTTAIDQECARLSRLLAERRGSYTEAFLTAPSPGIVAAAMENAYYDDLESYVRALGAALRTEYEAIARAGFVLQIDAPDLAAERNMLFHDKTLADFLGFVRLVVATVNDAVREIPRERVRLHMCWGNYDGPHDFDVPLSEIWGEVSRANVGAFLVSLANPRHAHEVRLFEKEPLPPGAALVAGVIDTTTNYIEHPEVVADRIERAVRSVGDPARIMAGTDCGFESAAGFASVAREVVWAKLRALADGAALASTRLFGTVPPARG